MVNQQDGGAPLTDDVRALDVVESVESITFVFGALIGPGPATGVEPMPVEALVFTGTVDGGTKRLVEGRPADPAVAEEFVATRSFVNITGSENRGHVPPDHPDPAASRRERRAAPDPGGCLRGADEAE